MRIKSEKSNPPCSLSSGPVLVLVPVLAEETPPLHSSTCESSSSAPTPSQA